MFTEVLAHSVEGCGQTVEEFKASRRYLQALHRFRELSQRYPRHSELGALLWAGPLKAGTLLHQCTFEEAVERARAERHAWDYNPEVLAGIDAFASLLLSKARSCLPDEMLEPRSLVGESLDTISSLGKPQRRKPAFSAELAEELGIRSTEYRSDVRKRISLRKIARSWCSLPAEERRTVGFLLANMFRGREKVTAEEDERDQPSERVLPGRYGNWVPDKGNRANCCGKAQLVAGFALWAKARAYAAVPLLGYDQLVARTVSRIAEEILNFSRGVGLSFSAAGEGSLKEMQGYSSRADAKPAMLHNAILLQNRNAQWLISDPNFCVSGTLSEAWQFERIHALLSKLNPVLPGIAYTACDPGIAEEMRSYGTLSLANCERASALMHQVQSRSHSKEELVDLLANSSLLPFIAKMPEVQIDMPRNASNRKIAICALLQFAPKEELRDEYSHYRRTWFVFVDSPEEELIKGIRDDADAHRLLLRLLTTFCSYGIQLLMRRQDRSFGGGSLCHPVLEFADLHWGLAISTLSHVACDLGLSESCEPELCHHTFRENQLRFAAGRSLRLDVPPDDAEQDARQALGSLPALSRSAELILSSNTQLTKNTQLKGDVVHV